MADYINKSIPRLGARELATGRALFSDDIPMEASLVLGVFRSDRVHALITGIDVEKARDVPGVAGVLTASDVPGRNRFGHLRKDQPVLADEKVRFVGEAVALVAAETEAAAGAALDAIRVSYQDLPPVPDPEEALEKNAPQLHAAGNVLFKRTLRKGDADAGFAKCAAIVKRTYRTPHNQHSCMELEAGVGWVDEAGVFVIHASTQNPHHDRKEVAGILGEAEERVRIVQAVSGGGFGSRLELTVQGFIALALYHFQRPVSLVFTREEVCLATCKRHPMKIEMKTGAGKDGRLLAVKARIICDTGAYATYGQAVATRAAVHAAGPYEVENVEVDSLAVFTNNSVAGAMRGFGVPQAAFAHESQMDILAEELTIDPLEFRRINALKPGSATATGQRLETSVGILKVLDAIEPHYRDAKIRWTGSGSSEDLQRGVGLAAMWFGIGNTGFPNPSSARVEMDADGKATLFTGVSDIGQGSTTVMAQIASEALGVHPGEIRLVVADTRTTLDAGATSASRQTYISGNAVNRAALKLASALIDEAAGILKRPGDALVLRGGFVMDPGSLEEKIPLSEVAASAHRNGRPLSFEGVFDPPTTSLDPETSQGAPYGTYAFACHLAMVEVDTLTGEVHASEIVAAHDVGKAIHPKNVEGQIQGGVTMGIGFALMEEFTPGKTLSMSDYHIPTSLDAPRITPIIIEDPDPTGPFGAKGVGEPALVPTAPAVINAIHDASGKRVYNLPATPEKVRGGGERSEEVE